MPRDDRHYVMFEPYETRDWRVFKDEAQAFKYAQGITALGRACHVITTTGNSFDETQGFLRSYRSAYVARLAARQQSA